MIAASVATASGTNPALGILRPGARQERHRDLGQVVGDEVVEVVGAEDLARGARGVAPERRPRAETDRVLHESKMVEIDLRIVDTSLPNVW